MGPDWYAWAFWLLATLTIVSAGGVAFSNNIVYSALCLMGTLIGAAGFFVLLAADFVAVVQVLVYVGGILVLVIFAVMLTQRIGDVRVSNHSLGRLPALLLIALVGGVMGRALLRGDWLVATPPIAEPTTARIGEAFLTRYVLPFELASVVLLAALVGAVVLSRKELREENV
jgi:NADH-quinone oxidoreductase subunit J